jgi:ABC-2 type transport system ATP-binding protein
MAILRAEQLTKTYRGASEPALRGVDLAVEEGEFFGLLGPNGAGKTTAISILCGLVNPTSGRVLVRDRELSDIRGEARRALGLVPQDIALYGTLTVRENVSYFGRMHGLGGKRLAYRVDAALALAGLAEHGDRRVVTLSGGMKRRANLAAGIVHEPSVLLLDEPTVGVDAQSRNAIVEALEALTRADLTIVYTTHYMEEAERLCSRVAILDSGMILAQGSPRELIEATPDCRTLEDVFLALTGRAVRD